MGHMPRGARICALGALVASIAGAEGRVQAGDDPDTTGEPTEKKEDVPDPRLPERALERARRLLGGEPHAAGDAPWRSEIRDLAAELASGQFKPIGSTAWKRAGVLTLEGAVLSQDAKALSCAVRFGKGAAARKAGEPVVVEEADDERRLVVDVPCAGAGGTWGELRYLMRASRSGTVREITVVETLRRASVKGRQLWLRPFVVQPQTGSAGMAFFHVGRGGGRALVLLGVEGTTAENPGEGTAELLRHVVVVLDEEARPLRAFAVGERARGGQGDAMVGPGPIEAEGLVTWTLPGRDAPFVALRTALHVARDLVTTPTKSTYLVMVLEPDGRIELLTLPLVAGARAGLWHCEPDARDPELRCAFHGEGLPGEAPVTDERVRWGGRRFRKAE